MRVASSQFNALMHMALQNNQGKVSDLMQQMSSGQRILAPSEDPIGSVRLLRMSREEAAIAQYQSNITALRAKLSQNETALTSMTNDLLDIRDLMVWAKDGGNSSEDMNAMAGKLVTVRDSLMAECNARDDGGNYLYSGTVTKTAPIKYDPAAPLGSRYSYAGNTDRQWVVVGNGVTQSSNVCVDEMGTLLNRLDLAVSEMQKTGVNINDPGTRTVISGALDGIDEAQRSLSQKIAGLGSAQNTLATLANNHGSVSVANKQIITELGAMDYSEANIAMNAYILALQATTKAYGKVSSLSLFDAI
ncbi:flagellar hook-associated protein FlgL [Paludibacterium paludis]|uniref:Flagellar hook-associated protein 3 n=1 Tax=Paludibacterium paludis TaxID=1225769 RepID=A0A918NXZ1_9NEIS|nr:flagellar hook-associated protein FlgL [Paludibacterium paludis]GGY04839.1 flagellar hook-associated protein 3 [Paludibacterium paludis]